MHMLRVLLLCRVSQFPTYVAAPSSLLQYRLLNCLTYTAMEKTNLFYLLVFSGLFLAFVSVLDDSKAKTKSIVEQVSYDVLKYQWVVAEAIDTRLQQDITPQHQAKMFQFLSSGGFVEFEDKIIARTGSWQTLNNRLEINYDQSEVKPQVFQVELIRPEELILRNGDLQMRLLRLQL